MNAEYTDRSRRFSGDGMVAQRHVPVRSAGSADQQQPRISGEAEEIREPAGGCGIPRAICHRAPQLPGTAGQVRMRRLPRVLCSFIPRIAMNDENLRRHYTSSRVDYFLIEFIILSFSKCIKYMHRI